MVTNFHFNFLRNGMRSIVMSTATISNSQCTNLFTQPFNAPFTNSMNITKGFLAHFYVSTIAAPEVISISDTSFSASFCPFTLNSLLMNEPI